ncbi:MAG: 5'/3'-nucleotidase SurE, partial [Clostridiales bacterium]|nr:5'/3'-nucleotidase SurE [Clostridiales bacterium]
MKILLVNDDGVCAPGLQAMIKAISKTQHEIMVIAPRYEMSSVGHHMSLRDAVRVQKIENYSDFGIKQAFALEGTPVDCIKFAKHQLKLDFDLVVSGINKGGNVGSDVVYSGTVAACIEANILGIPSIAVSSTSYDDNDYDFCADFIIKHLDKLVLASQP